MAKLKQRFSIYLNKEDYKNLEIKMAEFKLFGIGRLTRFMELISRNKILILTGETSGFQISNLNKVK